MQQSAKSQSGQGPSFLQPRKSQNLYQNIKLRYYFTVPSNFPVKKKKKKNLSHSYHTSNAQYTLYKCYLCRPVILCMGRSLCHLQSDVIFIPDLSFTNTPSSMATGYYVQCTHGNKTESQIMCSTSLNILIPNPMLFLQ